uniref:Uncharacterized protein n=1 Tax=Rhizophora mucronata TaxID=61149 RepID=A0A2P2NVF5_RHIMU
MKANTINYKANDCENIHKESNMNLFSVSQINNAN